MHRAGWRKLLLALGACAFLIGCGGSSNSGTQADDSPEPVDFTGEWSITRTWTPTGDVETFTLVIAFYHQDGEWILEARGDQVTLGSRVETTDTQASMRISHQFGPGVSGQWRVEEWEWTRTGDEIAGTIECRACQGEYVNDVCVVREWVDMFTGTLVRVIEPPPR